MGGAGLGTNSQLPQKLPRSYKAVPTSDTAQLGGMRQKVGLDVLLETISTSANACFPWKDKWTSCSRVILCSAMRTVLSTHKSGLCLYIMLQGRQHWFTLQTKNWGCEQVSGVQTLTELVSKGHSRHFNSGWFPIFIFSLKPVLGNQFANVVVRENLLIEMT